MHTRHFRTIQIICFVGIVGTLSFGSLNPAWANPVELSDGNSTAILDPMSQAGMSDWNVDGVDYLKQQWFWIASPQTTQQLSLDQVSAPDPSETGFLNGSTNEFRIRYGTSVTFWIDVFYQLLGGAPGSGEATLNETIAITNNTQGNLDFSFFQYSDFDLNPNGDSVNITTGVDPNTNEFVSMASQEALNGGPSMTESVSSVNPNTFFAEANTFSLTRDKLNAPILFPPLFLDFSSTSAQGDVTWAFQWLETLGPNTDPFVITKTKTITAPITQPPSPNPIPEPSTILLFGTGLLMAGLARKSFRR